MKKVAIFFFSLQLVFCVLGIIGCLVNNGKTGGFLSFPYAIGIGISLYYFFREKKISIIIGLIAYGLCIALNPLFNNLMEGEATEKTHSLVFIKETHLISATYGNDKNTYEDIKTNAEIISIKEKLKDVRIEIIHTFKAGDKFIHPFKRDLTTWIDGEMYLLDVSNYVPSKKELRYSYGGLNMGGSNFIKERSLELYQGDKVYQRSIYFKLSQFANWPVFPLAIMAAF